VLADKKGGERGGGKIWFAVRSGASNFLEGNPKHGDALGSLPPAQFLGLQVRGERVPLSTQENLKWGRGSRGIGREVENREKGGECIARSLSLLMTMIFSRKSSAASAKLKDGQTQKLLKKGGILVKPRWRDHGALLR